MRQTTSAPIMTSGRSTVARRRKQGPPYQKGGGSPTQCPKVRLAGWRARLKGEEAEGGGERGVAGRANRKNTPQAIVPPRTNRRRRINHAPDVSCVAVVYRQVLTGHA